MERRPPLPIYSSERCPTLMSQGRKERQGVLGNTCNCISTLYDLLIVQFAVAILVVRVLYPIFDR